MKRLIKEHITRYCGSAAKVTAESLEVHRKDVFIEEEKLTCLREKRRLLTWRQKALPVKDIAEMKAITLQEKSRRDRKSGIIFPPSCLFCHCRY